MKSQVETALEPEKALLQIELKEAVTARAQTPMKERQRIQMRRRVSAMRIVRQRSQVRLLEKFMSVGSKFLELDEKS